MFKNLPEACYSIAKTSNPLALIIIKRGESGYYKTDFPNASSKEAAEQWRDEMNERLGVTKAQRKAMEVGSMFDWNAPAANPECYDENGNIKKNRGGNSDE